MNELNRMEYEDGNDDDCEDKRSIKMGRKNKRSRLNEATKNPKSVSEIDRIIERIKPSVETRDECSLARHARCFVEISPAPPKWLILHKARKKKIKKKLKKEKGKKSYYNGEFPSDNANKTLMTDDDESQYDEICSFDSEINLSGVTLTPADKKIIEKNRQRYHQSREKKMENDATR